MGIVEKVAEGDIVDAGIEYAEEIVAAGGATRKIRDMFEKVASDRGNNVVFEAAAAQLEKTHRNHFAPTQILKCIEAAVNADSFEEGLETERKLFAECLAHPQREALIHIFFAERAANKIPDLSKETALIEINRGSIIGAGTMGGGIAMCFANAGIPVRLHDNDPENLQRGITVIEGNYARTVSRGRLSQDDMDKRMSLILPTEDFDDLGDADVVIEAVYENLDLKKEIFVKLVK